MGVCFSATSMAGTTVNIKMTVSEGPQLPTPGYVFMQQGSTCDVSTPIPQESTINSIWDPANCVSSSDQFTKYSAVSFQQSKPAANLNTNLNGCVNQFFFQAKCSTHFNFYHAYTLLDSSVPPSAFQLSAPDISFTNFNIVRGSITTTGVWYGIGMNLIVYYNDTKTNQWINTNYLTTGVTQFMATIPSYTYQTTTQFKVVVAGIDLNNILTIPSAISNSITMPSPRITLSPSILFIAVQFGTVNVVSFGVTTATISYTASGGLYGYSTIFTISVTGASDSIPSSCEIDTSCTTISSTCTTSTGSCTITGLTPGSSPVFTVSALNFNNQSPGAPVTINLYKQATFTSFTAVRSSTAPDLILKYDIVNGVPGSVQVQVLINGTAYNNCPSAGPSCTISSLSAPKLYDVSGVVTSGGASSTKNQMFMLYDDIQAINIGLTQMTTKQITISYNATGGDPAATTCTIYLNDVNVYNGICQKTKTFFSLSPGVQYIIKVTGSYMGKSSSNSITLTTYQTITPPQITLNSSTSSISLTYQSTDGEVGSSLYTVLLNNTQVQGCIQTTNLQCTISNLEDGTWYQVQVVVVNDGTTKSTSQTIQTYPKINSLQVVVEPKLPQIRLNYSVEGGFPGAGYDFYLFLNDENYTSQCLGNIDRSKADGSCLVSMLTPNTEYTVVIQAKNDGTLIESLPNTFITYYTVSSPNITITQTTADKTLTVDYPTENGVPGESVYYLYVNGTAIPSCSNSKTPQCILIGNSIPLDVNLVFFVQVKNALDTEDSGNITAHPYDCNNVTINVLKSNFTEINISWDNSTGGIEGSTLYTASISTDGNDWSSKCVHTAITNCLFDGLQSNTQYYFKVDIVNSAFPDSISAFTTANTLDPNPPSTGSTTTTTGSTTTTISTTTTTTGSATTTTSTSPSTTSTTDSGDTTATTGLNSSSRVQSNLLFILLSLIILYTI
ncbi:hypothetical protein PPL_08846 [Heterostelium album PN500]|uniref:Fibronectin type-III domain-containing protein n=1 Tax=Heterostelium pallidum (strain ATCC 26659 / Pp 5 / PN500) TaxID=670386 RepID=D3BJW6_HETP5|nr:hypothetical protein PPL_08846 [Heterostelium album PN500]EFA78196.1 hypothetical protein PPL_08846 [Heterostelium album PN500]|eukprot:XP_020430322.1 hypothetical protein PPL_08846 [Heterostelium album PN500]